MAKLTKTGLVGCVLTSLMLSAGCGRSTTTRVVEDPTSTVTEYGKPTDIRYEAQLEANKEQMRLTVYESSRCPIIPVTVMQRYQETLEGDEVVQRTPVTKTQVAGEPQGEVPCNQTYANDVEVLLQVDGTRVSLGETNQQGEVTADLARILQSGSYETAPSTAAIFIRPNKARPMVEAGNISLTELTRQQTRIAELRTELEAILAKGETGATDQEILRSYEIYNQLNQIAPGDPRVQGMSTRFWELFFGRKQEEARERMGRNLEALGQAKEVLKTMGDAAIPLYVQAAVNSGNLDRRALEWSSLRLIRALRGSPAVCSAGFAFGAIPSYGWSRDAEMAAHYVHYAYGREHASSLQAACRY